LSVCVLKIESISCNFIFHFYIYFFNVQPIIFTIFIDYNEVNFEFVNKEPEIDDRNLFCQTRKRHHG